jgi:hypothetical protein
VWAKTNAGLGSFYRSQPELIFVLKSGDAPPSFPVCPSTRKPSGVCERSAGPSLGQRLQRAPDGRGHLGHTIVEYGQRGSERHRERFLPAAALVILKTLL